MGKTYGAEPVKRAPVAASLAQELKSNPEWRARLSTWGVYAAATGATLAMASNADASIIYGVANVSASITPNAPFDSASNAFQIAGRKVEIGIGESRFSSGFSIFAGIRGVGPVLFADQGSASLINFNRGQSILTAGGFASRYGLARAIVRGSGSGGGSSSGGSSSGNAGSNFGTAIFGNFASGKTGFAGFLLQKGASQLDFGWLRIKVSDPNSVGYMTEIQALDWAYNDTAFGPIAAGEGAAAPEPGTAALALLASGAVGLLAWRRRRRA